MTNPQVSFLRPDQQKSDYGEMRQIPRQTRRIIELSQGGTV